MGFVFKFYFGAYLFL